jgi:hypothetical protein
VANGNQRPASPQPAFGQSSIKGLMGEPGKRFQPKFSSLQEALLDGLRRTTPAHTQYTDDTSDDDAVAETPRERSLESRLREVIGDEVYRDIEEDAMTGMALGNWLHSHGVKHLACARTLAHMIASHLDSMDLLDRITKEIEAIG